MVCPHLEYQDPRPHFYCLNHHLLVYWTQEHDATKSTRQRCRGMGMENENDGNFVHLISGSDDEKAK
jgi:hypothetical protein